MKKFIDDCNLLVKEPINCSKEELELFYNKVVKGGKVELVGLQERIKNCELLGFCYYNKELIGISAIKIPNNSYKLRIIEKSKINRIADELTFEIGYSFTEEEHRRKGLSKRIKFNLLEHLKSRKGIVFSTTAIGSSQNFLIENGFKNYGKSYDGTNDKNLKYYELVIPE
ncbi:putative GNAT family N-acyltransferase [Myroides gitamensis]|uniref:hypothetical protein n=1 Tax=Myroides odoratus TaxID=256 RepID=UPI002168F17B|nr:hypothetical protein [Myroides odoratus]MCS4238295.1 putative GNAT family N-acyltransferase [Myroides odoratus]MDH6600900.1 putative GNAT family N-acyltransferase [Myroides gitamensis]